MNKKIFKILSLTLLVFIIFSVGVVAGNNLEKINAYLNYGITVEYDDVDQIMTDANGNRVYPITYNDTTYLPVRAISDMLGVKVNWDGKTNTVLLGNSYPDVVNPGPIIVDKKFPSFKTAVYFNNSYGIVDCEIMEILKGDAAEQYILDAGYELAKNEFETDFIVLKYELTVPDSSVEAAKYYPLSPSVDIEDIVIGDMRYWGIASTLDLYNRSSSKISTTNKRYGEFIFSVPKGFDDWTLIFENKDSNGDFVCDPVKINASQFK